MAYWALILYSSNTDTNADLSRPIILDGSLPDPCHLRLGVPSTDTPNCGVLQTDKPLSVVTQHLCMGRDWENKEEKYKRENVIMYSLLKYK